MDSPTQDLQANFSAFESGFIRWLHPFLAKNLWPVVAGLAFCVSCLLLIWSYHRSMDQEFVFFTGARTTESARMADVLKKEFERTQRVPGTCFKIRLEETAGFDAIQERLAGDSAGLAIGFAIDASADGTIPSILVPLDWDYLHILCSRNCIKRLGMTFQPTQFEHIVPYLKAEGSETLPRMFGRVYVGGKGTATRRFAELVIQQYGLSDIKHYESRNAQEWSHVPSAIERGEIDLAFYSAPLGTSDIRQLSDDTVLLGIDEAMHAIASENYFSLWPVKLAKNVYRADAIGKPDLAAAQLTNANPYRFCPDELGTLASRRFLVCSSAMGKRDAFMLSSAAKVAFGKSDDFRVPYNNWSAKPPDSRGNASSPVAFNLPTHPGADSVRRDSIVFGWWNPRGWPAYLQQAFVVPLSVAISAFAAWLFPGRSDSGIASQFERSQSSNPNEPEARFTDANAKAPTEQNESHASAASREVNVFAKVLARIERAEAILGRDNRRITRREERLCRKFVESVRTEIDLREKTTELAPDLARNLRAGLEHIEFKLDGVSPTASKRS